ncbi:MAG TPA: hypothetical protein VHC73_12540, partial [Vitreimonas sp.]|nr:hypothetical protein [Vitreimonas sp.]
GYADKRNIYFKSRGNSPIHALTKDFANVPAWTLDEIEARQERLVRLLCEDWGLVPKATPRAA